MQSMNRIEICKAQIKLLSTELHRRLNLEPMGLLHFPALKDPSIIFSAYLGPWSKLYFWNQNRNAEWVGWCSDNLDTVSGYQNCPLRQLIMNCSCSIWPSSLCCSLRDNMISLILINLCQLTILESLLCTEFWWNHIWCHQNKCLGSIVCQYNLNVLCCCKCLQ